MKGERVPILELAQDDVEHFGNDGRLEIVGVVPSDAFISPDDPMVRDPFRAAMIFPDEPILRVEDEAGVVVGMDGLADHEVESSNGVVNGVVLDPDQVAAVLDQLAERLRQRGIAGLEEGATAPAFDGIKGYLREYFSSR
jgi:hypothetical protein